MIDYTIYNTETGLIHTNGTSHCSNINEIVINNSDAIIEGIYRQHEFKIVDGLPQSYTPSFLHRLRKKRNLLLSQSDWTHLEDSPLTDAKKNEWQEYRQNLRDLPQTFKEVDNMDEVIFPTPPI